MKITIKGITVPVTFHFGTLKFLSRLWGLTGVTALIPHFASGKVDDIEGAADMLYAAIQKSGVDGVEVITQDDAGDYILKNKGSVAIVIAAFQEAYALPQEDTDALGKPEAGKVKKKPANKAGMN